MMQKQIFPLYLIMEQNVLSKVQVLLYLSKNFFANSNSIFLNVFSGIELLWCSIPVASKKIEIGLFFFNILS